MLVEWKRDCSPCDVMRYSEDCHSGTSPIIARGECMH
jgi:hypothetical protein